MRGSYAGDRWVMVLILHRMVLVFALHTLKSYSTPPPEFKKCNSVWSSISLKDLSKHAVDK